MSPSNIEAERAELLPERIRLEIERYACEGAEPGPWLRAILESGIVKGWGTITVALGHIVAQVPETAWGSRERVEAWLVAHRKTVEVPDDRLIDPGDL